MLQPDQVLLPTATRKFIRLRKLTEKSSSLWSIHPQHLISDRACECEINRKKCDSLLLAKDCQHICLPKSKHYSLGVPEKAIDDPDRNTKAVMADVNIPPLYWDIAVQHVALLNACTSPSIRDSSITIFEADTGVVPDLAVFPPPGCFCIRYERKSSEQMSNWMRKMNLEYS
jgi:hypothetical protein